MCANEYVDMLLIYGKRCKNSWNCLSSKLRRKCAPNFYLIESTNNILPLIEKENVVFVFGGGNPLVSVRLLARKMEVNSNTVWKIFQQPELHSFQIRLLQGLRRSDCVIVFKIFLDGICWSDESHFHNNCIVIDNTQRSCLVQSWFLLSHEYSFLNTMDY